MIIRGAAALDMVFGDSWRELNRRTEESDKARAERYKIPCEQPGCFGQFCCVTVAIGGLDTPACRFCADKALAATVPEEA